MTKLSEKEPLYKMMELAKILRNNCPWDKEQTSMSLRPYLIEEAYEVFDAIESGDSVHIQEELGDLLYQVYAHSEIASEQKIFDIDDVANGIIEKLIRRHPHVFGDTTVNDKNDVIREWEQIKKKEREKKSVLEGVPRHLPALLRAYRVQQKASRAGFDWKNIKEVIPKLEEELSEFREAMQSGADAERLAEEAGDIMFSIVNVLRFAGINPEEALTKSVDKFIKRFRYIEDETEKQKKNMKDMHLAELDMLWEAAKKV